MAVESFVSANDTVAPSREAAMKRSPSVERHGRLPGAGRAASLLPSAGWYSRTTGRSPHLSEGCPLVGLTAHSHSAELCTPASLSSLWMARAIRIVRFGCSAKGL